MTEEYIQVSATTEKKEDAEKIADGIQRQSKVSSDYRAPL
jgi:hypothetical protein